MSARIAFLALTTAALVAGCGDPSTDRQVPGASDPESAATPGGSTADADAPSITASVQLEDRAGGTSIRVTLSGLDPEARYPVQIHEGPCADGGMVSLPLGRVTARPDGTGSVRMTVGEDRLPAPPFSVHVQGPAGSPAACADVDGTPEPRDP